MSAVMHSEEKAGSAVAETTPQTPQPVSFGTALLGFIFTTTLTTSLMVLLSQGG